MQNMSLSIKMFLSKIQSSIKKEKNLSLYENFSENNVEWWHIMYHFFYIESSFSLIMLNAIKKGKSAKTFYSVNRYSWAKIVF